MTNAAIEEMLKEILQRVDYDVYKGIYVNPEDDEESVETRECLIKIVKFHLDKNDKWKQLLKDLKKFGEQF